MGIGRSEPAPVAETPTQESPADTLDWEDLEEAIRDAVESAVEEADAQTEHELRLDDAGWGRPGHGVQSDKSREKTVKQSRAYIKQDDHCAQIARLYTDFSLGTGVQWLVPEDQPKSDAATAALTQFFESDANARLLSVMGEDQLSKRLISDGELFFLFFAEARGQIVMRLVDSLEITDIATDPEDKFRELQYKRTMVQRDGTTKTTIYNDWKNTKGEDGVFATGETTQPEPSKALMYHVNMSLDTRGSSLIWPSLKWCEAYFRFMKSRLAVQQALARVAQKMKIKGGAKQIAAIKAQHQSSLAVSTSNSETNPAQAYGSTVVEGEGATLSNMKQETGAAAAKIDGAEILRNIGVGAGIFPHWLGAGEAFRLATASAMDAPQIKAFEKYQAIWLEVWAAITKFVLEANRITDVIVDLSYPPIFPKAKGEQVDALDKVAARWPEIAARDETRRLAMELIGIKKADQIELEKHVPAVSVPSLPAEEAQAAKLVLGILKNGHVATS